MASVVNLTDVLEDEDEITIQSIVTAMTFNVTIATNTAGIATNVTNIATNTAGIATNVTNIATNASGIATNVTNISTNSGKITKLEGTVSSSAPSGGSDGDWWYET